MSNFGRTSPNLLIKHGCYCYNMMKVYRSKHTINNNSEIASNRPMVIEEDINDGLNDPSKVELVEPTNCCMSGCINCVWVQYAETLSKKLANSNDHVQKIIMNKVTDPNMRAFLMMELRCRNVIK